MIQFENIRWKNFLSTGDRWTEISLNDSKATLIVGSNGAGKSTLMSIVYGLYQADSGSISVSGKEIKL